ncbi:hypothetical protein PU630_08800 [Microbacterium horticulturae]|uniref:Uncharacterized protein n=1 Tax=Microbacterium horticulturae TaxID=3028316 RepID=A0ABY8BU19_9MICO|nr:hypothetical protein [Microbacterium sp. KACC 23027]WEG07370.1 hypothetical protein PU630_08800 [Microbacterium sp. KACC 23027]
MAIIDSSTEARPDGFRAISPQDAATGAGYRARDAMLTGYGD